MLYRSETFEKLDFKLRDNPEFIEVPLKRFRHKRAFRFWHAVRDNLSAGARGAFYALLGRRSLLWDTPLLHGIIWKLVGSRPRLYLPTTSNDTAISIKTRSRIAGVTLKR